MINFTIKQKVKFIIKFTRLIDKILPKIFSFELIGKVRVWYKLSPSLDKDEFKPKSFAIIKNLKAKDPRIINRYTSTFKKSSFFIKSKSWIVPNPHIIVNIIKFNTIENI